MDLVQRLRGLTCSRRDETRRDEAGYSLMEILIVLAIISLLLGLVTPRLMNQFERSKVVAARAQVREIGATVDIFRLDVGRYPSQSEGLSVLLVPPSEEQDRLRWQGPYLDSVPQDPWGNDYVYQPPPSLLESPTIMSLGADGEVGGDGLDADVQAQSS